MQHAKDADLLCPRVPLLLSPRVDPAIEKESEEVKGHIENTYRDQNTITPLV